MAHWARRNRLLLVAWTVIVAVAIPIALLSRDNKPVADREALVLAQQLDMSLTALPRYGETLFDDGQVAQAVSQQFREGVAFQDIVPNQVSLAVDPDSIVLRVVGHDPDPKTAADIANTAAATFVGALNAPGVGVGSFALLSQAEPDVPAHPVQAEKDALATTLTSGAVALVAVLAVGMAAGFTLGRLSPAHRDDRRPGAAQDPLF
jgi:capsular polysaccharide biosynthesis protein